MKKFLVILAALSLVTGVAVAENEICIYMIENPTPANAEENACYSGPAGQFMAYCVISDPFNNNLGTPIAFVGGFEFQMVYPAGLFVTPDLAETATNFMSPPDFFCGSNIPVVGGQATLITLTIGTFTTDPASWFLTPVSDEPAQSIPGAMAMTDAEDNFSISQAFPSSGSFVDPVFGMWTCPVPTEDVNWGSVKSLFR